MNDCIPFTIFAVSVYAFTTLMSAIALGLTFNPAKVNHYQRIVGIRIIYAERVIWLVALVSSAYLTYVNLVKLS